MHKDYEELNLTDQEITDLKVMREHFWKEDTSTRQLQLQKWRRLKFFWNNLTNVYYDAVAHDWRNWDASSDFNSSDGDQAFYDQRINVFKAYLESIFAALSILVPPVKAYPDDAQNSRDIETAKAADKIGGLIFRHNNAEMLWLHNLYIWGTEGLVCGYNYARYDEDHGTYKVDEYKNREELHQVTSCPLCKAEIDDVIINSDGITNPGNNDENIVNQDSKIPELEGLQEGQDSSVNTGGNPVGGQMDICPSCNQPTQFVTNIVNKTISELIDTVDEPKARVYMESYGGLNCKVPLYARKKQQVLYNFFSYEYNYADAIEEFPELYDNLNPRMGSVSAGSFDSYEQWARLNTEYKGEYPVNCVTRQQVWFRPSAYNILPKERMKAWKKKYPCGISVVFIQDLFAAAYYQKMDDYWTFEYNPLADYLSTDPLGMLLTSVQEITNDLIALIKQTIEHGVGLTFADPAVLDLNAYNQTEVVPGAIIPTKAISGNKKIQDGFFEIKTATLSGEVMPFGEQIQSLGQLASGAIPSLFGGQIEGSDTASQYSMSKNSAQSRLGLQWKTKCNWWKEYFGKAIKMYIKVMECDERDVQKRDDGSFVNIVILKSELSGKIGKFELAANENLPMSWSQKKDVIMQLLLSPNPTIVQWLTLPENQPVLRDAIGIDNFSVPGADDVDKQWAEIGQLIETEPIETGIEELPLEPSVEIDVLMDTHPIHFDICRKWAVSEIGQFYKYYHPKKYQNVLLHAKQHLEALQGPISPLDSQNKGMNTGQPDANGANQEKPKKDMNKAPITEANDVKAIN